MGDYMIVNESTSFLGSFLTVGGGGGSSVEAPTADGQLLFSSGSGYVHTETTELYWDDTNKHFGIGVSTPQAEFTFDGSDVRTQQYLDVTYNTNLGDQTFGAGNMAHTTGQEGYHNTAIGDRSMVSLTSGSYNTGCGRLTLNAITSGTHNTGCGANALGLVTEGTYNVGVGASAGRGISTGDFNVGMGANTLYNTTTGDHNLGIGTSALYTNITGVDNVAIGRNSLVLSTSSFNVGIGAVSGDNLTAGSYNIAIGYNTDFPNTTGNYQLNIGNTIYGNVNTKKIGIGTTTPDGVFDVTPDTITTGSYSYPFPRVTTTQRNNMAGMLAGAHVYDTDLNSVYYYNGTSWTLAY
jgi:hypothetical protein